MNRILRLIYTFLVLFGFDPRKTLYSLKALPRYLKNRRVLNGQEASAVKVFPLGRFYPCFDDWQSDSGVAKGHYFHQDLLVARKVYSHNPDIHVDVGSRIDGFVAHVASFRSIKVVDLRPLPDNIPNVTFIRADMMTPITADLFESCDSVSCLHALEHFGLGRYGDQVSYDGYLLGLDNLYHLLKKAGKLYLSVPIGPQRIEFDAHRVFSVKYLLELFRDKYHIDSFSFVDDMGDLHEDVLMTEFSIENSFNCVYGCGIFEMTKL